MKVTLLRFLLPTFNRYRSPSIGFIGSQICRLFLPFWILVVGTPFQMLFLHKNSIHSFELNVATAVEQFQTSPEREKESLWKYFKTRACRKKVIKYLPTFCRREIQLFFDPVKPCFLRHNNVASWLVSQFIVKLYFKIDIVSAAVLRSISFNECQKTIHSSLA